MLPGARKLHSSSSNHSTYNGSTGRAAACSHHAAFSSATTASSTASWRSCSLQPHPAAATGSYTQKPRHTQHACGRSTRSAHWGRHTGAREAASTQFYGRSIKYSPHTYFYLRGNVVFACTYSRPIRLFVVFIFAKSALFFPLPSQCSPSLLRKSRRSPFQMSTSFSKQHSRAWSRSAWLLPQTLLIHPILPSH